MFTSLLKAIVKDTNEEPDDETHRARSGKAPSTVVSVPMELEVHHLPVRRYVHQPEVPQTPSQRHDQLLAPFPVSFPFEEGGRAENSKLLITF